MTPKSPKLSVADRLRLIKTLNALPSPQFDMLVFALDAPAGNVPGNAAPQGDRSSALLTWVNSPIGPGLAELQDVLDSILDEASSSEQPVNAVSEQAEALQETIKVLKENQAPKYDLRGATFGGGVAETVYGDQVGSKQVTQDE